MFVSRRVKYNSYPLSKEALCYILSHTVGKEDPAVLFFPHLTRKCRTKCCALLKVCTTIPSFRRSASNNLYSLQTARFKIYIPKCSPKHFTPPVVLVHKSTLQPRIDGSISNLSSLDNRIPTALKFGLQGSTYSEG